MAKQPVAWKKRILLPFWAVRVVLMLFIIGVYAWALKVLRDEGYDDLPGIGVIVVFMLLIIAVLLMDILQILMFLRDSLSPLSFLIMNSVQTAFWAAVLLLDLVSIAKKESNATGIGLVVFIFLTFLALLVYAAVGFHRQRQQAKRGHYAPAHNPAMPAPNAPAGVPSPYHAPPVYQQNTAYHSPAHTPAPTHNPYQPPYQAHGAAADYYNEQPAKPAHMV
ncbi:hypothetical protein BU26DRAFT_323713 [Trematosphaeria pertusa]|uniref:MARVEL domain-containing protein n=1 Tax=Trematosphaeria pertusa TaxID=390896 RepID=A0A6A6IBZ9_9PLEO|nr:uncharacterized protein BU26DRAFT_323713 [Trematosphaeria pertusa]KAF2247936.1 hypothetical protein BU26DRAFT_323713 [Trematosphaeria pertusa]